MEASRRGAGRATGLAWRHALEAAGYRPGGACMSLGHDDHARGSVRSTYARIVYIVDSAPARTQRAFGQLLQCKTIDHIDEIDVDDARFFSRWV